MKFLWPLFLLISCVEQRGTSSLSDLSQSEGVEKQSSIVDESAFSKNIPVGKKPAGAFDCQMDQLDRDCAFIDPTTNRPVNGSCLRHESIPLLQIEELTPLNDYWPNAVVVIKRDDGNQSQVEVHLPSKKRLSIENSKTSGLQEAINYASKEGYDLYVYGKGAYSSSGDYQLSAPLVFPEMNKKIIHMTNVNLLFDDAVQSVAMVFKGHSHVDFKLIGSVVAVHADTTIEFRRPAHSQSSGNGRFYFGQVIGRDIFYFNTLMGADISQETNLGRYVATTSIHVSSSCGQIVKRGLFDYPLTLGDANGTPMGLEYRNIFRPGEIVLTAPDKQMGKPPELFDEGGFQMDLSSTATSGLYEAINLAVKKNRNLLVLGGRHRLGSENNAFDLSKTLEVPQLVNKKLTFLGAHIELESGLDEGIIFEGMESSAVKLIGHLQTRGANRGILVRGPMKNSYLCLFQVAGAEIGVQLSPGQHQFQNNKIQIQEIVGTNKGLVINGGEAENYFTSNQLHVAHIHNFQMTAIDIGLAGKEEGLRNNVFEFQVFSLEKKASRGLFLAGRDNQVSSLFYPSHNIELLFEASPNSSGNIRDFYFTLD